MAPQKDQEAQEQPQDVETGNTGDDSARLARMNVSRKNRQSTMTILTMDKSKSFYEKEYKKEHLGESREYWRDMILGINDGLVSTFLLVTGVYGSGMSSKEILLTSIAGLIA